MALAAKEFALFRRTKALETEIDEFLDKLSQSALVFKHAISVYLNDGASEEFEEKLHHINELETSADELRRAIETQLYTQTLIPDSRGDVLGLLENLDSVLNQLEGALWGFSIEVPEIPPEYNADYRALADLAVDSVESLVLASRAFFRNIEAVGDHMHKVMFFEKEADKLGTKLKRAIFATELRLSHKAQLRNFVEHIDNVADMAEDVAERLAIYTIKRTV
jgi:hypothetical protein